MLRKTDLLAKITDYQAVLVQVAKANEGSQASFLTYGFCVNGELELIASNATNSDEIVLVDNLSRDCRIVTDLLYS